MSRTADVGSWVRVTDRSEHYVKELVRGPHGVTSHRVTACGLQLYGDWDAVMIGPTRVACPRCVAWEEALPAGWHQS